jgi:hypothetical protein
LTFSTVPEIVPKEWTDELAQFKERRRRERGQASQRKKGKRRG